MYGKENFGRAKTLLLEKNSVVAGWLKLKCHFLCSEPRIYHTIELWRTQISPCSTNCPNASVKIAWKRWFVKIKAAFAPFPRTPMSGLQFCYPPSNLSILRHRIPKKFNQREASATWWANIMSLVYRGIDRYEQETESPRHLVCWHILGFVSKFKLVSCL